MEVNTMINGSTQEAMQKLIDNNICIMQPVQTFMWYAEYNDGTKDTEFKSDMSETTFDDIKKDQLKQFGLLGNGGRIYFDTKDGIIHLGGGIDLNLAVNLNNVDFHITGNKKLDYTNIIQFKKGIFDFGFGETPTAKKPNRVGAHFIGHKGYFKPEDNSLGLGLHYQMFYELGMMEDEFNQLLVRLTPDKDVKGTLELKYLNNLSAEKIDLSANACTNFAIRV